MTSRSQQIKLYGISLSVFVVILALYLKANPDPGYFQNHVFAGYYEAHLTDGALSPLRGNAPGQSRFIILLHELTGLSFRALTRVPIGLIGRALFISTLLFQMTHRLDIAGGSILIIGFSSILTTWGYNSTYIHSFAFLYFALGVLFLSPPKGELSTKQFVLAIVFFIGVDLFDYTAEIWALAFPLFVVVLGLFNGRRFDRKLTKVTTLLLICGLVYMSKSQFYQITPYVISAGLGIQSPVDFGGGLGIGALPVPKQYRPLSGASGGIETSNIFYLVIGMSVLGYVIVKLRQMLRDGAIQLSEREIVVGGLMLGGGTGTVGYLFINQFTGAFILFASSLAALFSAYEAGIIEPKLHGDYVIVIVVAVLLLLSGVMFTNQYASGDLDRFSDSNPHPSAQWTMSYSSDNPRLLSGITTIGRFRYYEVEAGRDITMVNYNITLYDHLVTARSVPTDYVAVDYGEESRVRTLGWMSFRGLHHYSSQVNTNPHLNRVYSDGDVSIYEQE